MSEDPNQTNRSESRVTSCDCPGPRDPHRLGDIADNRIATHVEGGEGNSRLSRAGAVIRESRNKHGM